MGNFTWYSPYWNKGEYLIHASEEQWKFVCSLHYLGLSVHLGILSSGKDVTSPGPLLPEKVQPVMPEIKSYEVMTLYPMWTQFSKTVHLNSTNSQTAGTAMWGSGFTRQRRSHLSAGLHSACPSLGWDARIQSAWISALSEHLIGRNGKEPRMRGLVRCFKWKKMNYTFQWLQSR